jgi:hypothetical protein
MSTIGWLTPLAVICGLLIVILVISRIPAQMTYEMITKIQSGKVERLVGQYWIVPTKNGLMIVDVPKEMEELKNEFSQQKQSKGKRK